MSSLRDDIRRVIVRPVISEKSFQLVQAHNQYTFRVLDGAHKTEIRQAIEDLFDVTVTDVRTVSVQSKPKRRGATQGPSPGLEEGHRRAAARRQDRALRGGLGHGHPQIQAHLAWAPHRHRLGLRGGHQDHPREVAARQDLKDRRAQQQRPRHQPAHRRRPQAPLPHHRLQAPQGRRSPPRLRAIEYDPNRSARIALLHYADGEKAYILAPLRIRVGDTVMSGPTADIKPGNSLALRDIPTGTTVHNVELQIGRGGQLCRSAGIGAQLMAKDGDYATVRLPSERDAPRAPRLPRDRGPDRQHRPTRTSRSARPVAAAGRASGPRCVAPP